MEIYSCKYEVKYSLLFFQHKIFTFSLKEKKKKGNAHRAPRHFTHANVVKKCRGWVCVCVGVPPYLCYCLLVLIPGSTSIESLWSYPIRLMVICSRFGLLEQKQDSKQRQILHSSLSRWCYSRKERNGSVFSRIQPYLFESLPLHKDNPLIYVRSTLFGGN